MYPNKNPTIESFLEEIAGIADKEYQRRVWIRGEGPECDDFDEAVCRYSNAADAVFEKYKECDISDIQIELIKKFHEEFKRFWKKNDLPKLFIDTPEWTKISLMAKEILHKFNYQQNKDHILDCVLTTISHIGDQSYQKRVWIQGEGPEVDDFDETVCHFFQEGDGVIEKYQDFGLTDTQVHLLRHFRAEFRKFSDKHDLPQLFIDTAEWAKIILMAREVLHAFNRK